MTTGDRAKAATVSPVSPHRASRRREHADTKLVRAALVAALIASFATALVLLLSAAGTFEGARLAASDILWPIGATDSRVVVVGVDAASVSAEGSWPWSRRKQAQLIDAITDTGASVVAMDVVYDPAHPDEDDALVAALRRNGHVVLASIGSRVQGGTTAAGRTRALVAADRSGPIAVVSSVAAGTGTAIVLHDKDTSIRRVPAALEQPDGTMEPALSLAAVDALNGTSGEVILRSGTVRLDDVDVPVGRFADLRIAWAGQLLDTGNVYPATSVLQGKVPAGAWRGKVVFVGVTDPSLGDQVLVPGSSTAVPGVIVHAEASNTILTHAWVLDAPLTSSAGGTWLLAFAVSLAALRTRLRWHLPFFALALAVAVLVPIIGFLWRGWLPDVVRPPAAIALAAASGVGLRSLDESRERRRVGELFARYVPEQVARQLIDDRLLDVAGDGQRVHVGVFFCDLRGFTPMAAALEPADVRRVLEAYYEFVCAEVFRRDGTVMQFVGDEVFAVFGAPLPRPDGAAAALECARAVQDSAHDLRQQLRAAGLPEVRFGIGVHAGVVVAAHVGTDRRRQYAVVGDTVNVGSRLCGVAAADEVVASAAVAETDGGNEHQYEVVALKGVAAETSIVRLVPRAGQSRDGT